MSDKVNEAIIGLFMRYTEDAEKTMKLNWFLTRDGIIHIISILLIENEYPFSEIYNDSELGFSMLEKGKAIKKDATGRTLIIYETIREFEIQKAKEKITGNIVQEKCNYHPCIKGDGFIMDVTKRLQ